MGMRRAGADELYHAMAKGDHLMLINQATGKPYKNNFLRDYARGKECQIRIAAIEGMECASTDTTVLCHLRLPGLNAMGKKLMPDLLGAHGCATCHDIIDARYKPKHMTRQEIELYHWHGMGRTIDLLRADGVLQE